MRIGFEDSVVNFDRILDIVEREPGRPPDGAWAHREGNVPQRGALRPDRPGGREGRGCPVLANGNVTSAARADQVVAETGHATGVMIGRHAIRNPWIFRQCRERFGGQAPARISLSEVREYVGSPVHGDPPARGARAGAREQDEEVPQLCRTGGGRDRGFSCTTCAAPVRARAVQELRPPTCLAPGRRLCLQMSPIPA